MTMNKCSYAISHALGVCLKYTLLFAQPSIMLWVPVLAIAQDYDLTHRG